MRIFSTAVYSFVVIFLVQLKNGTTRPLDGDVTVNETASGNVTSKGLNASPISKSVSLSSEMTEGVRLMSNRVWNLNLCEQGIQLKLGKEVLNKDFFYCTKEQAMTLEPMLFGDSLEGRVYVWCKMAAFISSDAGKNVNMTKSFDVEDLEYFEGDVILNRENVDDILDMYRPSTKPHISPLGGERRSLKRKLTSRRKRKITNYGLWRNPDLGLQYNWADPSMSHFAREIIQEAITDWQDKTCIRFKNVSPEVDRNVIQFRSNRNGCFSAVGMRLNSPTIINIGEGCEVAGLVAHDIGHALGLRHEHVRLDRDAFVTILKENISNFNRPSFWKSAFWHGSSHGVPYDYSSVMHYGSNDFGNGKMTIRTKDPRMQQVIGQRVSVSFLDAKLINIAYCGKLCGSSDLEWTKCQNGGYRNPKNCSSCLCPEGLAPPFCEMPSKGVNVDCGSQILNATSAIQILTSPGFHNGTGLNRNAFCPWLIKASSPGKRVRLVFFGRFHFYKQPWLSVCEDRVEVRYKDLSLPGPRHCDHATPRTVYHSHGAELLVTAQTLAYFNDWQGFQVIYTEENCGGCSDDSSNQEPACLRTVKYKCTLSARHNLYQPHTETCVRDEKYCCDGFNRSEDNCIRNESTTLKITIGIKLPSTVKSTMITTTQPMSTTKNPMASPTKPMDTTTKSITTTTNSMTFTAKPMTTTTKPMTTTTKPMTSTAKPMTTTTKPMTFTAKPMTTTKKPMSSTTKPRTSAVQQTTQNIFRGNFYNS